MRRMIAWAASGILAVLLPGTAAAQSSADEATAAALFKQGRELMAAGKFAGACPKLAESQKLDPGAGTLLNLASCYEKNGQIASAWTTYQDAATAAQQANEAGRVKAARTKVAELEPKLPTLAIVVSAASDRPDLDVKRDGTDVARAAWGTPIPVDPGMHTIDASAPGHAPWHGQSTVDGPGSKATIEVPPLAETAPAPAAAPPPTASAPPLAPPPSAPAPDKRASPGSGQRLLGLVLGGVGVGGAAVGAVFGVLAISQNNAASGHCNGTLCDGTAVNALNQARTDATIADIAIPVGVVALAAGAVLYLTAPRAQPATGLVVVPGAAGASIAGLTLRGGW